MKIKKLVVGCLFALLCISFSNVFASTKTYEEIVSETFERGTGSPVTETISVELANSGQLWIANSDLVDDAVELSSATELFLDGEQILNPFYIEPGASHVRGLSAGLNVLEITMKGKPGGSVIVKILEEITSVPYEIRYELLSDGTVRDNKTGLIWHRYWKSPGSGGSYGFKNGSAQIYISDLNNGYYGDDIVNGNAGKTDWRVPTVFELKTMANQNFGGLAINNKTDDGVPGYLTGMQFGDPFLICGTNTQYDPNCPNEYSTCEGPCATSTPQMNPGAYFGYWVVDFWDGLMAPWGNGYIWPVSGEMK